VRSGAEQIRQQPVCARHTLRRLPMQREGDVDVFALAEARVQEPPALGILPEIVAPAVCELVNDFSYVLVLAIRVSVLRALLVDQGAVRGFVLAFSHFSCTLRVPRACFR